MQALYDYRFQILLLLFLINVLFFWPGHFMADSAAQYNQAILGQYTDHHPPLMSFLWRYIDIIYTGRGLMFALQQVLIYSSVALLLTTMDLLPLRNKPLMSLLLLALPNYPQILMYDVVILKDVQFAFSFLLSGSILAYYTVSKKRPPVFIVCVLLIIMLYGAAVKYQGQFCVIILAIWLGCLLCFKSKIQTKIIVGLIIYALILSSIFSINNYLVPKAGKNYSWQLVKLYDLAAISIATQQDLIPDFNKLPSYSFKEMQDRFAYPAVDSLALELSDNDVITSKPIIGATTNADKMSLLSKIWLEKVLKHPLIYLKHRAINMSFILLSRPGYKYSEENKDQVKYANVFDAPYVLVNDVPKNSPLYGAIDFIYGSLFYIFMSHLPVVILGLGYFILSIITWRYSSAAPVLLCFSSISLLMVGILFFMSMAGTPRYTFISIVMVHAMHVFAYTCYSARKLAIRKL